MVAEVEAAHASEWLCSQLFSEQPELKSRFRAKLQELLLDRYQGHWYPDEPHRGCGFRSLMSTLNFVDPLLEKVAEAAGVKDILSAFSRAFGSDGELIIWVNPGEVKVLRGKSQHLIWSDGSSSDNPYSKMRINIEPTRLAVKVDMDEHVPGSPASSVGGGSVGHNQMNYGWQSHGSYVASSGSVTPHDMSPTESPCSQPWRATYPPTMAPLPPHQNYMAMNSDLLPQDSSVNMSAGAMGGALGSILRPDSSIPQQQQQHAPGQQAQAQSTIHGGVFPPYAVGPQSVF